MKSAPVITLTDDERRTLTSWSRGRRTPARLVLRARIVLAAAEGTMNQDIAAQVETSKKTVSLWRRRFAAARVPGPSPRMLRGPGAPRRSPRPPWS